MSEKVHIPNGIPVNFTSTFGTVIPTAYTVKGKASTILNLNSLNTATVTTTASLDNQTVNTTGIISTGVAVLNITSTAIDNSTGLPLNTTYNIPLNESVIWLSIVWIPTTISGISNSSEELQIILDGTIVLDRFIYNTNGLNNDTINFTLSYPGVSGLNLTVTDPNSSNVTNLEFPGDLIERTSQITYTGSPYEGVKSFAIATTKVTKEILQYWSNQYSNYETEDAMNLAYGTFLASLLVEYSHDLLANNITSDYNITWERTSPIVVSTCQDANEIYMTLESDHSMGMTVIGTLDNMWMFNYICSYNISFIENAIMNSANDNITYQLYSNGTVYGSVIMDLISDYLFNSTSVEAYLQNSYMVVKSVTNDKFVVIDLETGIVRDINTVYHFCGTYTNYFKVLLITGGIPQRPVTNQGETISLGTISFWFNGGLVFLYVDNPYGLIWIDDEANARNDMGESITFGIPTPQGYPPNYTFSVDLLPLIINGYNRLTFTLVDVNGGDIGCSALYVVYDNYGATAHSIITSNLYELATRLTINDEYDSFKEWFDEFFDGFPLPMDTPESSDGVKSTLRSNLSKGGITYGISILEWLWEKKHMRFSPIYL